MKHVFVVDPQCFQDRQWQLDGIIDTIGQYFRNVAKPDFTTLTARYPREALGLIQSQVEIAEEGSIVRVYAVGGEELVFDCLNGIAELPDVELAIVPYSKKNDFLKMFGDGKLDLFKDIKALVDAKSLPTDIINTGNNVVLNNCFVGLIADLAKLAKNENLLTSKGLVKVFFKFVASMNKLFSMFDRKLAARTYRITVDNTEYTGQYSFISVANGRYYNGKKIAAPKATPNDGFLDVTLMRATTGLGTWWSMGRFSRGKASSQSIQIRAKKITVFSEDPFAIQLDTEFLQDTNITFEVLPEGTQIVAFSDMAYPASGDEGLDK